MSLWLNLSAVNSSHELFFTCGTPELYNMGDYHFAVQNGKVHWLEELPGGGTRFNVFSSELWIYSFFLEHCSRSILFCLLFFVFVFAFTFVCLFVFSLFFFFAFLFFPGA